MDELAFVRANGFRAFYSKDLSHALEFNPKVEAEWHVIPESGMLTCTLRNVLKHPHDFIEILKLHPAFNGSDQYGTPDNFWVIPGYIPGFRQRIHAREILPLISLYVKLLPNFYKPTGELKIGDWFCSTNIFYKGMKHNLIPHFDEAPFVATLWLTEGLKNAGTGLYTMKVNDTAYYNIDHITNPKDREEYDRVTTLYQTNNLSIDGVFQLYDKVGCEFNSIVAYQGRYFHQAHVKDEDWPEDKVRYSLLSFLKQ